MRFSKIIEREKMKIKLLSVVSLLLVFLYAWGMTKEKKESKISKQDLVKAQYKLYDMVCSRKSLQKIKDFLSNFPTSQKAVLLNTKGIVHTALSLALENEDLKVAEYLIEQGADAFCTIVDDGNTLAADKLLYLKEKDFLGFPLLLKTRAELLRREKKESDS